MNQPAVRGARYTDVPADYFDKRGLERHAGLFGLWALGVAAVISGDFSGWNFGIAEAGWGGLVLATGLVVVMYVGMVFSIGEMAAALPHAGGAYSFARSAFGPWGGFVTGYAETIEYVGTTAVIVFFSAGYADAITAELFGVSLPMWAWWIVLYAVFLAVNIAGVHVSFRFAEIVAVGSLSVIAVFGIMAVLSGRFSFDNLLDIEPAPGNSRFLPFGLGAVVSAMPFAMWFFLGIEELPLAAEEAHDPVRDIPRAGTRGLWTLVASAVLVLVLNPAITGSAALGESEEPLLDGFRSILPDADIAAVLAALALVGLFASLQGIMYAYGRNIYSLSRSGYYPRWLSLTGRRRTPWAALLVGAVAGYGALLWAEYGGETAGAVVLNIAVWGAVVAYVLQMASYLALRHRLPDLARPYRSPTGRAGAVVAGALALVVFAGQALDEGYRSAIVAIGVVYGVGLVAFAVFGRNRLVLSPEELAAVEGHA
jgi:ethanolamine permease